MKKGNYIRQIDSSGPNSVTNDALYVNRRSQNPHKKLYIERIIGLDKVAFSCALLSSIDKKIIPAGKYCPVLFQLVDSNAIAPLNTLDIIQSSSCDTIILKVGNIVICKVTEIGRNKIRYLRCNNLNGTTASISKSDVSVVIYSNGRRDYLGSPTRDENYFTAINPADLKKNVPVKQTTGLSVIGFLATLTGLLLIFTKPILAFVLSVSGFIFGKTAYDKIGKNPDKFKGKGLATFSIIIGGLYLASIIFALLLFLTI